jgi:3-oxoacyl-[acyl-carrier-protein] synthase-3
LGADGNGGGLLSIPAGGSRQPITAAVLATGAQYLQMNGREIYKFGVRIMVEAIQAAVARTGLALADIDLFVPHQANLRIIESAASHLGVPAERVMTNLDRYGNTSAASIPIALCEAADSGRLSAGDRVAIVGMGSGLTWGAGIIQWTHSAVRPGRRQPDVVGQPVLVAQ